MDKMRLRADPESLARRVLTRIETSVDQNFNGAWINTQINSGKRIVDIGVDLDPSFYRLERNAVDGYPRYSQDLQLNSDLRVLEPLDRP